MITAAPLVWRAEHVLRQRMVQYFRINDLIFLKHLAPESIRVQHAVAEVLRRHLRQRLLRDVAVVEVAANFIPKNFVVTLSYSPDSLNRDIRNAVARD
jgi:hypothetical protein